MKKVFHIIGAGHVGQTVAAILRQHPHWQLSRMVSRTMLSEHSWFHIVRDISELPFADVVLIATPDNVISQMAEQLAALPWLNSQTVVVHFSGAKTVSALQAVADKGAVVGSLHPVFAFADVQDAIQHLAGNSCALEGQDQALPILKNLADALGLNVLMMPSEYKARYHAALSVASNFSVALAAYAQNLLLPLGLSEQQTRKLVCGMMQKSVNNLNQLPPLQALTGPIVRGDDSTVRMHLDSMNEEEQGIYRAWAKVTLDLAEQRLDTASIERIATLLQSEQ